MDPFRRTAATQICFNIRRFVKFINLKGSRHINSNSCELSNSNAGSKNAFKNFEFFLDSRRNEANRSILVQVKTRDSCNDLLDYCGNYGKIKHMHFYTVYNINLVLIEFETVEVITELLSKCKHLSNEETMPVRSSLLWFRAVPTNRNGLTTECNFKYCTENVLPLSDEEISGRIIKANSLSDQISCLYNSTKLNDISIRLRFLAANQIETALSGMFSTVKVFPFGSSVNSFGKIGCDLDLVLQFNDNFKNCSDSRLIFHVKPTRTNRNYSQKHMEIIGDILQYFMPGCSHVLRILNARVPILRYKHDLMGLDCDLSACNMTAVYMSELLYLYGSLDKRVCPLIFAIRFWAKEINLTNHSPGRWITNFSLTLLVLFYLQNVNVVPPLQILVKYRRPQDERICEDGTDCSFLRDLTVLPKYCSNTDNLATLLLNFFRFYSMFDFSLDAISLNTGTKIPKPEYAALYIVNPLEKHLNVSKNVSPEECTHINIECQNAAWLIESSIIMSEPSDQAWGLLYLVKNRSTKKQFRTQTTVKNHTRLMVKELFNEDEHENKSSDYKVTPLKST